MRRLLLVLALLPCSWLDAAEPPTIEPALNPNAEVVAKLKALPAGHAVLLGKAAVVGEFNDTAKHWELDKTGPRGRDFTIKMVWAPERKRALFCGANHGVPHRINDVWEFDLGALTWAMLYAPDNARDYGGLGKDYSDVEFKNGILITKRGGPAIIAHTWWGLTYDPELKSLLFMNTWVTNEKKAVESLGGNPAELYAGPPLWSFSPSSRQWKMHKADPPYPRAIFGGLLEYVPELQGSIWHANNWQMRSTWRFDVKQNAWTKLAANTAAGDFEKQAPEPEQVGYYDPQLKRVIVQRQRNTFEFDPVAVEWKKVAEGTEESAPFGHDAYAPMVRDSASGHGLLVEFKTNTLWDYDPAKHTWAKLSPQGDPLPEGNKRLAYADPAYNVLVVIQGTTVWAFRYR